MKVNIILAGFFLILPIVCVGKEPLTTQDYKKMSDSEIRMALLHIVSAGMTREQVQNLLKKSFHSVLKNPKINSNSPVEYFYPCDRDAGCQKQDFSCLVEPGDFTLFARLDSWWEGWSCFLCGTNVESLWLFNSNGVLKDVQVEKHWDGP